MNRLHVTLSIALSALAEGCASTFQATPEHQTTFVQGTTPNSVLLRRLWCLMSTHLHGSIGPLTTRFVSTLSSSGTAFHRS